MAAVEDLLLLMDLQVSLWEVVSEEVPVADSVVVLLAEVSEDLVAEVLAVAVRAEAGREWQMKRYDCNFHVELRVEIFNLRPESPPLLRSLTLIRVV